MEPIHVPGPSPQAFNKNRRISDLIRAQVNHLKHLEASLPPALRATLPQHDITTEQEAAAYIAPMTRLLRAQSAKPATPIPITTAKRPTPSRPSQGLAIAASAQTTPPPKARRTPSATKPRPSRKGKK